MAIRNHIRSLGMLKRLILQVPKDARHVWQLLSPANSRAISRYLQGARPRKLHLGCGDHILEGWLNCDVSTMAGVVFLDATQRFPLPDNSFDFVYSEHMIEHIPVAAGISMLRECYRVLRPGGSLRVVTPDFAFLRDLHRKTNPDIQAKYVTWSLRTWDVNSHNCSDPTMFVIDNFFRDFGHEFIYDASTLQHVVSMAGFEQLSTCRVGESSVPEFCGLEREDRMPEGFLVLESQVLEGRKPDRA